MCIGMLVVSWLDMKIHQKSRSFPTSSGSIPNFIDNSSSVVWKICSGLRNVLAQGAIEHTNVSFPTSVWLSTSDSSASDNASWIRFPYSILLSSGRFHVRSFVSKFIPSAFPFVLLQNALSFCGHSSASWIPTFSHTSL